MKSLRVATVVCLLLAAAGWWQAYRNSRSATAEIQALRGEILQANGARDRAVARAKDLAEQLRSRNETDMARSIKAITGDVVYENELEAWLGRIDRLKAFLSKHPDKQIPEMSFLTAKDWLDVASEPTLETEADFRKALARARGLARSRIAPHMSEALRQAISANDHQIPKETRALAAYLPPGIDPAILKRFALNSSGQIDGLRDMSGESNYVLIESPVDDLWDLTNFYSQEGGWGTRWVRSGEESVVAAMKEYRRLTGVSATNASQLQPYLKNPGLNEATRNALFKALTSKAGL